MRQGRLNTSYLRSYARRISSLSVAHIADRITPNKQSWRTPTGPLQQSQRHPGAHRSLNMLVISGEAALEHLELAQPVLAPEQPDLVRMEVLQQPVLVVLAEALVLGHAFQPSAAWCWMARYVVRSRSVCGPGILVRGRSRCSQ